METLLRTFISCCFFSITLMAATPPEPAATSMAWFTKIYGQIHPFPKSLDEGVMTIACGQALEIYSADNLPVNKVLAGVGDQKGLLLEEDISKKRPSCSQEEYPRFIASMNLTPMDVYYLGRFNDLLLRGRSKAK